MKAKAEQYEIMGMKTSATPENYDPDPAKNPDLKVYQQIAALKNLKPGTTYYYRVYTKSEKLSVKGSIYFFKTAPESSAPVNFALLSDLQQKKQIPSTVRMIGRSNIDFIVYNGDLQNTPWKAGEWFPVEGCHHSDKTGKEWFTVMQQTGDGCRLLQYVPLFPCPGNHELTDQRVLTDKSFAKDKTKWDLSVYMQLFRPLYPEQRYKANGTHWYSADWGDVHLVSLSLEASPSEGTSVQSSRPFRLLLPLWTS